MVKDRKYKLALVSYYNTLPFVKGLADARISLDLDVQKVTPAECAKLFIEDEVDISLIPVGALPNATEYKIFGNYCIGAVENVRTVSVFSNTPFEELDKIYLDEDSRTSSKLVRIIQEQFLGRNIQYIPGNLPFHLLPKEGMLNIGDKVFKNEGKYLVQTDLAGEWIKYTGLPAVFAVWVAKPHVEDLFLENVNSALTSGLSQLEDIIVENENSLPWVRDYLTKNLSFTFDSVKMEALTEYLNRLKILS